MLEKVKLKLSRRRKLLLGTVGLFVILAVSSFVLWQSGKVAEAAVLDPHPGLVGWWRFDEGSGTVAGDSSGNGNNGTISGATFVPGMYGNALSFPNNVADYVQIPNSASLQVTGDLTIACWVKITALSKQTLVYKYWGGEFAFYLQPNGGATFAQTSSEQYVISPGSVVPGVWAQIAVIRNATSKVLTGYVNGVASLSYSYSIAPTSSSRAVLIGVEDAAYFPLNGIIDEVQIYNRALSPAEILTYFQNSPDFSSYLLAKVPMGTTQVIATLSWQGTGSINATIISPAQNYSESTVPVYQKTVYSTSGGVSSMLNIKRLSISVNALATDQNWYVMLTYDNTVSAYQLSIETQK